MADQADVKIVISGDVTDYESAMVRAERAAGRFAAKVSEVERKTKRKTAEIDRSTKSNEKLAAAARAAGGRLGEMAERMANASKAAGTLGAVGLSSVAVFTTLAAAYAGVATGIVALVSSAVDLEREYRGVIDVTEDETAALRRAESAFDALEGASAQAAVTIGASFAGDVAQATVVVAKLVLATEDLFKAFESVTGITSGELVGSLLLGKQGYDSMRGTLDLLDLLTQQYDDDVRDLADGISQMGDAAETAAAKMMTIADAERALRDSMERRAQAGLEGEALIDRQVAAAKRAASEERKLLRDRLEGVEEYGEEWESIMLQIDRVEEDLAASIEGYEKKRTEIRVREEEARLRATQDAIEAEIRLEQERLRVLDQIGASNVALAESFADQAKSAVTTNQALNDTVGSIGDANKALMAQRETIAGVGAAYLELADQAAASAIQVFKSERAQAIASIILQGARAAMTFSQPPPSGIGYPQGVVAAGALTATQLAIAAATQEPQRKHSGGVVGYRSLGAGDVPMMAQVGEEVLTPEQRAQRKSQEIHASFVVGSRTFDAMVLRSKNRGSLRHITGRRGAGQSRFSRGVING